MVETNITIEQDGKWLIEAQSWLTDNPCRGIVAGRNDTGHVVQISWIMGRSNNSKNRVYVVDDLKSHEGSILKTHPADTSKVEDSSLIIYNVMRSYCGRYHIISNGDQTDTIYENIKHLMLKHPTTPIDATNAFYSPLMHRHCESDAEIPIFTPRISMYQDSKRYNPHYKYGSSVNISVLRAEITAKELWIKTIQDCGLKKDDFRKEGMKDSQITNEYNAVIGKQCGLDHQRFPTVREFYELPIVDGTGYLVTTYAPGSKKLDSFNRKPLPVPLIGGLEEIMDGFWNFLEPEWRVALGGKEVDKKDNVRYATPINRFEKV